MYRRLHRQSLPRAAAWNMESFLYRQLGRPAASQGWIPLGERKTPDCPACAHTRYGNGNPEVTLCKTTKIKIIRYIESLRLGTEMNFDLEHM